jgi:uncharacterized membrane protein
MRFSGWLPTGLVMMVGLGSASVTLGQDPPTQPVASCEQRVHEYYKQLSAESLVPQATALEWWPELVAIVKQLMVSANDARLNDNRAQIMQQNWLRTLADQRLPSPPAPTTAAPAN